MGEISKKYLLTHNFEESGLEVVNIKKENTSKRFSSAELGMLPGSDGDRFNELNKKIYDTIYEVFGDTSTFAQKCNLNYETVRKYSRVGSKKSLPKVMLAKFVVACGFSVDQANEFFELHSSVLQPKKILLDAVIVHCLENSYDLDEFFETCKQVGLEIEYKE